MENRIEIELNGQKRTVPSGYTIMSLLEELGLNQGRVAVEVNREIIRRKQWPECKLEKLDRVEIVHFVGGGSR